MQLFSSSGIFEHVFSQLPSTIEFYAKILPTFIVISLIGFGYRMVNLNIREIDYQHWRTRRV